MPEKSGLHPNYFSGRLADTRDPSANDDAVYAARIQIEEDALAAAAGRPTSRGLSDSYY